jgi:hypothetical protein
MAAMKTPAPHYKQVSIEDQVEMLVRNVTYALAGALAPQTLDLAVAVDLVVLKHSKLVLLALVLDLLGGGVDLLLPLLATTTEAEHQVEGALLLDVVVGEGPAVLELLAGEDQPLLVRGNSLLVLDLGLDIVDGVGRLHLEGDSLPREGLDEDLHDCLLKGGARLGNSLETSLDILLGNGGDRCWCCDSDREGLTNVKCDVKMPSSGRTSWENKIGYRGKQKCKRKERQSFATELQHRSDVPRQYLYCRPKQS